MFLPDFEKVVADSLEEKESSLLKFANYCLYGLCCFFILAFLITHFFIYKADVGINKSKQVRVEQICKYSVKETE